PFGLFAKCWTPDGLNLSKALEASYATDMASLEGGGAFCMQSLDTSGQQPKSCYDFRDMLAGAISENATYGTTEDAMIQYCADRFNLAPDTAADWVDRF